MDNTYMSDVNDDNDLKPCPEHIWVWGEDQKSIYCNYCKLIKYIKPGVPLE